MIINKYTFLLTVALDTKNPPKLFFDNGATIGHFNHITCVNSVHIGKKVLTADKVHISDNTHDFSDINIPILDQKVMSKGKVSIGDGTWIGEGVSILSAAIGKNCVIGSNAVVVKDIPDFSIAVGIPARVVKRFNVETRRWEPTTGDGKFICRPGGEI